MKIAVMIVALLIASFLIFWAINLSTISHLIGQDKKVIRYQIMAFCNCLIAGIMLLISAYCLLH